MGMTLPKKVSAIAGGTIAGAAAIEMTVFTGGISLSIVGGMMAGAAVSSLIHGSVKAAKREKICGKDFGVDVGVGFDTGIIGSGGVAATESLASVAVSNVAKEAFKRGAVKLGVRAAGGIVSSELCMKSGIVERATKNGVNMEMTLKPREKLLLWCSERS